MGNVVLEHFVLSLCQFPCVMISTCAPDVVDRCVVVLLLTILFVFQVCHDLLDHPR